MGATGGKRRDGRLKKDQKVAQPDSKSEKGASLIEATKEAVPVVLKLRLFVGGLGPRVGAIDLQQRFAPLGTVHKIDLVEGKKGWDPEEALQRGFAYVDFEASSEASLRKLFSAYNGCKWKGGVLRVEKAKEHYTDRLRREWAEAEAEAAVKAKIAEKIAAKAISHSRDMYSTTCEDVLGSPESNRVEPEEFNGGEGYADEIAVDGDAIAAQIEKERKRQLDLLSKLFPDDKDAGDEEEKVIEIAKLRAYPMAIDVSAKKRKQFLENPSESVPVASSLVQLNDDEAGVASVPKSLMHESSALDTKDSQKTKYRRVKFSEEADAPPIESTNDEKRTIKTQHKDLPDATNGVRSILKKAQEDSEEMDVDKDGNEEDEEEDEEYYPSSRSPSPEGGLSDDSKWERLYKYAGLKKGPELSKPSDVVFTGISLDDDDDDEEPALAAVTTSLNGVGSDGVFSGVLSEQEVEIDPPQQSNLGNKASDSVVSKKKKKKKKTSGETTQLNGVGSEGIFSCVFSEPEEEGTNSPQPSTLESKDQNIMALKKTKGLIEEPEMSFGDLLDQDEESSGFEDAGENLQVTESDASSDSEQDENEDSDIEDFVDAEAALRSLTPAPLNEAAKASKWAKMFKSATSVVEPVEGVFSGSLDEDDVPVKARPAVREQKMFESAATNQTASVSEAATVPDNIVISEMEEEVTRHSSGNEDASTSSADIADNNNVGNTGNNNTIDASGEEEGGADNQQKGGVVGGNLLARFNVEQDESLELTNGAQSTGDLQQAGKVKEGDILGLSNSTPRVEGENGVDDNSKWMQRATWKSLMGADGRAAFSLKQLTGEPEATKATDLEKAEKAAVPEQSFGAFSFNFTRKPPEASTSRIISINSGRAEKMPKSGSVLDKSNRTDNLTDEEAGCSFMKPADAEKEWRASKSELRVDSKAKHKAAVRKMKKMKGSGGAR